jgi:hypothetical protein
MKKKILTLLFAAGLVSLSASSQTIKQNIDKQAKDKNTMDRSAKADVLIQKKTIYDSSKTKSTSAKVISQTTAVKKIKYNKHKYKKKARSSSK